MEKKKEKTRFSLVIDKNLLTQIKIRAVENDVNISECICKAIEQYLQANN